MKTNFEKVREFHEAFGVERALDEKTIPLRMRLINEEVTEVYNEIMGIDARGNPCVVPYVDKQKLAKELADLLYVVYGAADVFSIPIDEVFAEVHRSNMSKLGDDGKPVRREDGKVLKGPNYSPANLEGIVNG